MTDARTANFYEREDNKQMDTKEWRAGGFSADLRKLHMIDPECKWV